ncbi:hypothetical protein [Enterococcus gallinarum]|uniref:hypothetical protein n=1 Tax=Enterococcus gallinarum TaxID=1353 RepID=UPI001AD7C6C8|nr:50S ribosomal protein L7/L12 [Enterococcus gallinarum]MBO6423076.1 50S ribosomal protein L7/L12 [Enterococcus gallinarum]
MEYALAVGIVFYLIFTSEEKKKLKNQVKELQNQLNECCKRTGNKDLCSYFIADEISEKVLHLKNSGKVTEAIKEIRTATTMDLVEAKEYVDKL